MGWITTSQEVKRSLKTTFNVNVLVTIGLDLCTLLANIHAEKFHISRSTILLSPLELSHSRGCETRRIALLASTPLVMLVAVVDNEVVC